MAQSTPAGPSPTGERKMATKNAAANAVIDQLRAAATAVKALGDRVEELEQEETEEVAKLREELESAERNLAEVRLDSETIGELIDAIHDHRRGLLDNDELYAKADAKV